MAECSEIDSLATIQTQRGHVLAQTLAAMRVAEKADVIMVCGGKEFYAHRLVLEASSSYFTTMFKSNLAEAKSGKVVFKDIEPETLEAILDFLYLVDVKKLETHNELRNVLEASHLMGLQDLFQYCCSSLLQMLSPQNFLAIWSLAENYEAEQMLAEAKSYFVGNSSQIVTSKYFLTANVNQLNDLVVFYIFKVRNIDRMLKGIVLWLLHDWPARKQFISELFALIDATRVSKQFVKSLLDDGELMAISKEIANRLKDIVTEMCFVGEKEFSDRAENDERSEIETNLNICGRKLFVLQQQQSVTKESEGTGKTSDGKCDDFASCIQLFDLDTMTWQSKKHLTCVHFKVDAICEFKNASIFLVGSTAGNLYVLYDLHKHTLRYAKTTNNLSTSRASACYFKDFIYLVGGTGDDGTESSSSVCLKHDTNIWYKTSALNHSRSKPVLFTSDQYMFVTSGKSSLSKQFVEYTDGTKKWRKDGDGIYFYEIGWTIVELPMDFINADVHFFPYSNQLCGVYNSNGVFVKLMCEDGNWYVDESPKKLHKELNLCSVSQFPTQKNPFLLISTADSNHGIPNYVLNLESLEWTALPKPREQWGIKEGGILLTTACYQP